jgi:hypothetical protein
MTNSSNKPRRAEPLQPSFRSGAVLQVRRTMAWYRHLLSRGANREDRLLKLRWLVEREDESPFAMSAAVARLQGFLADPLGYKESSPDWSTPSIGLTGHHVPLVLRAQALRFRGDHDIAASTMEQAIDAISRIDNLDAADGRHVNMLVALAHCFIDGEELAAGKPLDPARRQSTGKIPLLPYLARERSRHLALQKNFVSAFDELGQAAAAAGPVGPEEQVSSATSAALLALDAAQENVSDADALLELSERRFLAPAAELLVQKQNELSKQTAQDELSKQNALCGALAFWRGRITLARAERAGNNHSKSADLAGSAVQLFEKAGEEPSVAAAADGWLTIARKLHVIQAFRCGDPAPAIAALQAAGESTLARTFPADPDQFGWRFVEDALRFSKNASASFVVELGLEVATHARDKRAFALPPASVQRLVLEIDKELLDKSDADRLIGGTTDGTPDADGLLPGDKSQPTLGALRRLLRACFGVDLPSVLIRSVADARGQFIVLLDGSPITKLKRIKRADRFEPATTAGHKGTTDSWLFTKNEPELANGDQTGTLDVAQYVVWCLGEGILNVLPQLADQAQATTLGLEHLKLDNVLPFLQLLLADRTPLRKSDVLSSLAEDVALGRLSPQVAVQWYRRVPGVRETLWGINGDWTNTRLLPQYAQELAKYVGDELAAAVPRKLKNAISQSIQPAEENTAGKSAGENTARKSAKENIAAKQAQSEGVKAAHVRDASGHIRVVVEDPRIRTWVRQLAPIEAPVVTEDELQWQRS